MHPTEISVLFDKANRFITKDSVKKEKQSIKKEVNEDMMVNGPSDDAALLTNPEAQEEKDDKETNKSEQQNSGNEKPHYLDKYKQQVIEESKQKYSDVCK